MKRDLTTTCLSQLTEKLIGSWYVQGIASYLDSQDSPATVKFTNPEVGR